MNILIYNIFFYHAQNVGHLIFYFFRVRFSTNIIDPEFVLPLQNDLIQHHLFFFSAKENGFSLISGVQQEGNEGKSQRWAWLSPSPPSIKIKSPQLPLELSLCQRPLRSSNKLKWPSFIFHLPSQPPSLYPSLAILAPHQFILLPFKRFLLMIPLNIIKVLLGILNNYA